MRNVCLFLLLLGIGYSCSENNDQSNSIVNGIGYAFTDFEQKAIREVEEDIKSLLLPSVSRTNSKSVISPFQRMLELDKYELSFLPYYEIDIKKFYSNPSPDTLRACIILNPLLKWILARKEDKIDFKILIENRNNTWIFKRYAENWGKTVAWLNDSLNGVTDYKLFLCDYLEFFEMKRAGKYYYYTSSGKLFSEEQMCEYFVDMMSQKLADEELLNKKD